MFFSLVTALLSLNILPSNKISIVKPNVVFFTGGNSLMPSFIYSNFIEKLEEYYTVNVINNLENKDNNVLEKLLNIYKEDKDFIAIGHSSGATSLLNYCNKFDINKYILLDPVDNNKLINNNELEFKDNKVLIINAAKSYKWKSNFPLPQIPFIPIGKLENKFENYNEIIIKEAGHCDILDDPYNSFMNKNFAEGLEDRQQVKSYQNCLINLINLYTMNNLNNKTVGVIDNYNLEYEYNEN